MWVLKGSKSEIIRDLRQGLWIKSRDLTSCVRLAWFDPPIWIIVIIAIIVTYFRRLVRCDTRMRGGVQLHVLTEKHMRKKPALSRLAEPLA